MKGREMAKSLTKMQCLTKRREGADEDLFISAYMEKLKEFPADTVAYVLDKWPDGNIFFPAWAELKEELEFWNKDRRQLFKKVSRKNAA